MFHVSASARGGLERLVRGSVGCPRRLPSRDFFCPEAISPRAEPISPPIQVSSELFATVTERHCMAANIRLKAARVLKGMTQLQLAEKMGRREIEISRIETGRAQPDPKTKNRIAELLQKPAFELFEA